MKAQGFKNKDYGMRKGYRQRMEGYVAVYMSLSTTERNYTLPLNKKL